ncbi:uncharacterized protein LOC131218045 [Magnolia sinica]|uniref:uncharacterized protein LOC131218045 n=1 Tax=Magnolia sinica TaxID=86752 RepID=UPI0026594F20|nr:uncharacterized protein LOC131218045 [Magnolia sinica]
MKNETSSSNKLTRCLKAPFRVLCRARDFYIKSMNNCSSRIDYGAAMGCPAAVVYTLPKSFSMNSTRTREDEELRELLRIVSKRERVAKSTTTTTVKNAVGAKNTKGLPKSFSMGIGKIDEDEPCYFQDDFKMGSTNASVFPRSRSYGMGKRRGGSLS